MPFERNTRSDWNARFDLSSLGCVSACALRGIVNLGLWSMWSRACMTSIGIVTMAFRSEVAWLAMLCCDKMVEIGANMSIHEAFCLLRKLGI